MDKADRTSRIGKELDKPGMETYAIGGSKPNILIDEPETGGSDGVGLGESRKDGHIDESLLKGHQQRHPGHHQPSHSVQKRVHVRHHFYAPSRSRSLLCYCLLLSHFSSKTLIQQNGTRQLL